MANKRRVIGGLGGTVEVLPRYAGRLTKTEETRFKQDSSESFCVGILWKCLPQRTRRVTENYRRNRSEVFTKSNAKIIVLFRAFSSLNSPQCSLW